MITPSVAHFLPDLTAWVIALSLQPELGVKKKKIIGSHFSPRSTYHDKVFTPYFVPTLALREDGRLTFLFIGK